MQQFNNGLHIGDLVREELDHSLVASHFAEPVYYLEKLRDVLGDRVCLRLDLLLNVVLKEPHYWGDKLVQNRIENT
jgi:hypothetical protein